MTELRYDLEGVEDTGGEFEPIPVGVYTAVIDTIDLTTSSNGNEMLKLTYRLRGGEYDGRLVWDQVLTEHEPSAWKYLQFLQAVGIISQNGKKRKGKTSTEKLAGTAVQVRIKHETDDRPEAKKPDGTYPIRSRVQNVMPMPEDEELPEEEEEVEEEEIEEEEEDVWTYEDIADLDIDDLKEINEDEELGVRITAKSKLETVRSKIADALGVEPDEEDEEEEEEEEEEVDYESMSQKDLKAACKERGLSAAGTTKTLIKKLRKDDESADDSPF